MALMDARSIAATAANKGYLTPATEYAGEYRHPVYHFDSNIYANRVFDSKGVADPSVEIQFGPNIKDWPTMPRLAEHLVLKVVSEIHDPVTTTDELIPSGETSSYRSNPLGLAEFTLSRKPGDGSAREQAASCQKVLGGWANIANEYATKRYRSNLINWGMLPFLIPSGELPFKNGDYLFVPDVRKAVEEKAETITAYVVGDSLKQFEMKLGDLTDDEREIILKGCLINYYRG